MGNAHNCAPKLQAYPPIFSLTPKASGSTRLQSCEVHTDNILCAKKLSQPVSSATQHLSTGEFGEELVTLRYRKFAL